MTIDALVDSNVIIAVLAGDHEHHASSANLFDFGRGHVLGVPAIHGRCTGWPVRPKADVSPWAQNGGVCGRGGFSGMGLKIVGADVRSGSRTTAALDVWDRLDLGLTTAARPFIHSIAHLLWEQRITAALLYVPVKPALRHEADCRF